MTDYSFLFIGGGNTFKLLYDLKSSGAFVNIQGYLNNGGVVFGGSAGAIIFICSQKRNLVLFSLTLLVLYAILALLHKTFNF